METEKETAARLERRLAARLEMLRKTDSQESWEKRKRLATDLVDEADTAYGRVSERLKLLEEEQGCLRRILKRLDSEVLEEKIAQDEAGDLYLERKATLRGMEITKEEEAQTA